MISKLTLTDDINRDLIKWNLTNTEMKLWMTFMKRATDLSSTGRSETLSGPFGDSKRTDASSQAKPPGCTSVYTRLRMDDNIGSSF